MPDDGLLQSSTIRPAAGKCQGDFFNEITCTYIPKRIQELRLREGLVAIRQRDCNLLYLYTIKS
jgi:hypothetical protein